MLRDTIDPIRQPMHQRPVVRPRPGLPAGPLRESVRRSACMRSERRVPHRRPSATLLLSQLLRRPARPRVPARPAVRHHHGHRNAVAGPYIRSYRHGQPHARTVVPLRCGLRGQRALRCVRQQRGGPVLQSGGGPVLRSVPATALRRQQEVRDAPPPADVRVQVGLCGERERRTAVRARSAGVRARRGLLVGLGVSQFPVPGSVCAARGQRRRRPSAPADLSGGQVVPGARPSAGVHLHEGLQSVGVDLPARQRVPGGPGVPKLSVRGSVRDGVVCAALNVLGGRPSAGVRDVPGRLRGGRTDRMSKR